MELIFLNKVCKIIGASYKTLYRCVSNNDTMPLPIMVKFANQYHYSLDYILGLSRKNVI